MNSVPDTTNKNSLSSAERADAALGYYRGNLRAELRQRVKSFDAHWDDFAASWSQLEKDTFMGDGGAYRYRRYAVFQAQEEGGLTQLDEQRHYQSVVYNTLNGGLYREYPCFEDSTLDNPVFRELLEYTRDSVQKARRDMASWRFETHQFRILANGEETGKPVPEGIHQDGVDYVFIFMVDRANVRGGVSRVYKPDGHLMAELKLRQPMDFMVVNDHTVFHYVTPVYPRKPDRPAHRDVLVITVRGLEKRAVHEAA